MNKHYRLFLVAAIVAVMVLAAGCLSQTSDKGNGLPRQSESVSKTDTSYWGGSSGAPAPTMAPTQNAGGVSEPDVQKLIKRASVNLEVTDTRAALDQIRQVASSQGGYIGDINLNRGSSGRYTGSATLRVPPDKLDSVLTSIETLGKVISQNVQVEDVTEEYVDLNARRQALAEERESYERIMQKAEKVEDILKTQEQISRVQGEINRIDGRLKYLSNRVDYASISVQVHEPEPVGSPSPWSLTEVINDGISAFLAVAGGIIIGLFMVLPFLVIAGIAYLVYRRYLKRSHQKQQDEKP